LLRAIEQHPLTLVSAPAGAGKTTLLTQALGDSRRPVAWVSLDEGDNDAARFWMYVLAALDALSPGIMEAFLPATLAEQSSPRFEMVLAALLDKLKMVPNPLVLALDDYQVVTEANTRVHRGIAFLVEHAPPHLHLVLASRTDPPLPLARLRAHGGLAELRTEDLRLSPEEAAAFLAQRTERALQDDEVTALYERTEGWIAGLSLAALSQQGRADRSSRSASVNGWSRHTGEYFAAEVLDPLPSAVQTFLLETAVLDRLSGPLCDAVTGSHQSQTLLESLERDNVFLVPLDDERQWYRYHHLFADTLQHRLRQLHSERIPGICLRASLWYEEQGQLREAVEYAFKAPDFERAARLLETEGERLLEYEDQATLCRWLERLPDEVLRAKPHLNLFRAHATLLAGQFAAFAQHLRDAEASCRRTSRRLPQTERALLRAELLTLRAAAAFLTGDLAHCNELCQQALTAVPGDHAFRSHILLQLGIACWLQGDVQAADQVLEEARRTSEARGAVHLFTWSAAYLGQVRLIQGRLQDAQAVCLHARRQATDRGASADASARDLALGLVLFEQNDLEAAATYLERGIRHQGEHGATLLASLCGYPSLARVRQACGDTSGALQDLEQALADACDAWHQTSVPAAIRAQQARLWLMQGNIEAATRWARDCERRHADVGNRPDDATSYVRECERIALADVYLTQGNTGAALTLSSQALETAIAGGRLRSVLQILVLQARIHAAREDSERALTTLNRALELAEPEQFVRIFLDGGPVIRRLLALLQFAHARQRGSLSPRRAPSYVELLLAAFRDNGRPQALAAESRQAQLHEDQQFIERLTPRELEVLRLLACGASNKDIARELVLATGTAKRHVSNIFSKLGVQSRTQAISRATMLQIIAPQQALAQMGDGAGRHTPA
jgi:LuxR family maltose regulon positive regulatory protein